MTDLAVVSPPAAQTLMIDLDKIDIPKDSRPHSQEKLSTLTESLKDGQEQEIGVVRSGDRFELVFGKGRVLGLRALKAAQIRARVYETLTEAQKLDLIFSENEEREDANPIYQAYLLQKMVKASGLSQNKFAQSKGKTKGWISKYRSFLKMPDEVLKVFTAVNTSAESLRALKRLKNPELQIQVAKEVQSGKTKPEDIGNRCLDLMPGGGQKIRGGVQNPPDPYADLWSGVRDRIDAHCQEAWQIGYVPFKSLQGEEPTWMFALMNRNQVSSQRISAWLKQVAKGIDDAHLPDPDVERRKSEQAEEAEEIKQDEAMQKLEAKAAATAKRILAIHQENKAINQKAAELWLPKTAEEAKEMKASPLNFRLPTNPAEWAEVEAVAPSGPGAVYQWMLGAKSYWTKKASGLTWQDLEYPDALTGCHKLIDKLVQSRTPAPSSLNANRPAVKRPETPKGSAPSVNPLLEGLDPETRTLVEAELAKGPLI